MQQLDLYNLITSTAEKNTELVPASDPRSQFISIDPNRMSGAACIVGTRVPVNSLFDHLAGGVSLDGFLDDFEGVPREKCLKAIAMSIERLMEGLPTGTAER